MTTSAEIITARDAWIQAEQIDTWDLPADHPAYLAKCAAFERYMALALADTRKSPETPLLSAGGDTIALTPASRALTVNANETHPLRVIQPGSIASKTDWNAQAAKRAEQYASAKARVDANKKGLQS